MENFETELKVLINRHSMENGGDTPDFLLARYLDLCLRNYNVTVKQRDRWYDFEPFKKQELE